MSRALFNTTGDYLHSPVDDLESFFWVAVWSVFFNKADTGAKSAQEMRMQDELYKNNKEVAKDGISLLPGEANSGATEPFQFMLIAWGAKVDQRRLEWFVEVLRRRPDDAKGEYYLPHFHRFALRGVVDVLEVLETFKDDGINSDSWAVTPPT